MTQKHASWKCQIRTRMEQSGARIVPAEGAFWLREKSAPELCDSRKK